MADRSEVALSITSFRGATQNFRLDFDSDKRICLIFGENGTGKSTIVDALDLVCNGRPGSLSFISGADLTCAYAINSSRNALKVDLTIDGSSCSVTTLPSRQKKAASSSPKRAHILRRSQITKLLIAQPHERYEALRALIDLTAIEEAESGLNEEVKELERLLEGAQKELDKLTHGLKLLSQSSNPDATLAYEDWAKCLAGKDIESVENTLKICGEILRGFADVEEALQEVESSYTRLSDAIQNSSKCEDELRTQATTIAGNASLLVNLLERAKLYFDSAEGIGSCPVCGQEIEQQYVMTLISGQLDQMKSLVEAQKALNQANKERERRRTSFDDATLRLSKAAVAFNEVFRTESLISALGDAETFPLRLPTIDPESVSLEQVQAYVKHVKARVDAAARLKTRLVETKKTVSSDVNVIVAVKDQYSGYIQKRREREIVRLRLKKAKDLYSIINTTRKHYSDETLSSISERVHSLYSSIHPDEDIGGLRLELDPQKRSSVNISAKFHTEVGSHAIAYFSESHMDTLGICVFLALAELTSSGDFLILDDVLTSCDAQHLERVTTVLNDILSSFCKVIITTHYRRWERLYKAPYGHSNNVQLVQLQPWTLPLGVRSASAKVESDDLRECLSATPLDRQAVASKAGVLLEALLDRLALLWECKLPHRAKQEYSLVEYLSSFKRKLKELMIVERHNEENGKEERFYLRERIDQLIKMSVIRNEVGCHFRLEDDTPEAEVIAFGEAALELAGLLTCSSCGTIPDRTRDGACWSCKCACLRLHPLKAP